MASKKHKKKKGQRPETSPDAAGGLETPPIQERPKPADGEDAHQEAAGAATETAVQAELPLAGESPAAPDTVAEPQPEPAAEPPAVAAPVAAREALWHEVCQAAAGHAAYFAKWLNDGDSKVRTVAVECLGRLGGPAVVPLLEFAKDDEAPQVRTAAEQALRNSH